MGPPPIKTTTLSLGTSKVTLVAVQHSAKYGDTLGKAIDALNPTAVALEICPLRAMFLLNGSGISTTTNPEIPLGRFQIEDGVLRDSLLAQAVALERFAAPRIQTSSPTLREQLSSVGMEQVDALEHANRSKLPVWFVDRHDLCNVRHFRSMSKSIDEREQYIIAGLAYRLKGAKPGAHVALVIGDGHIGGLQHYWDDISTLSDLSRRDLVNELCTLPSEKVIMDKNVLSGMVSLRPRSWIDVLTMYKLWSSHFKLSHCLVALSVAADHAISSGSHKQFAAHPDTKALFKQCGTFPRFSKTHRETYRILETFMKKSEQ